MLRRTISAGLMIANISWTSGIRYAATTQYNLGVLAGIDPREERWLQAAEHAPPVASEHEAVTERPRDRVHAPPAIAGCGARSVFFVVEAAVEASASPARVHEQ